MVLKIIEKSFSQQMLIKKHYKAAKDVRSSKFFKYKHFIEKIIEIIIDKVKDKIYQVEV